MSELIESNSELMKIALESVKTEEQAIQLIEGNLLDAILVKAQVHIENRSGILLFIFSIFNGDILTLYSIFGNSPLITRIRTFEIYSQFALDTVEVVKAGGIEAGLSDRIGRAIYKNILNTSLLQNLSKINKRNYEELVNLIQNGINLELNLRTTKANLDTEKVSSIKFRTNNILTSVQKPILNPYTATGEEEKKVTIPNFESDANKIKTEKEINELQKEFQKVVICKTVVSPVAGIEFSALKENTKLLFLLPFQTEEEIALAKQLGAVNKEGENKPISGTFHRIVNGGKNEFHIFAKGPNGILFRAFEERPVRLATPKKIVPAKKVETNELSKFLSIVIGVLFTLVAILVFLYLS